MTKKLLFLIAFLPSILLAQHSIKGTFTPSEEYNFVILYKVTPSTSMYVNNAEIQKDGSFEFKLDSLVPKGIYRVVYALPQEDHNFDVIYNTKEDVVLDFNPNLGVTFKESKENILLDSYYKSIQEVSKSISAYYKSPEKNEQQFKEAIHALNQTQNEFEKAAKGTIASHFIKASKPYIPTNVEDAETFTKNLKSNYFKNIDFSNNTLQSSAFLIDTVLNYIYTYVDQKDTANSYQQNIDDVILAFGENLEIKEIILKVLWNEFAQPNTESIANYITDNYLLEIVKAKNNQELLEKIQVFKNISLGELAPNFTFKTDINDKKSTVSLHDYNEAKQNVIVFWSSTCSHCLKELPLFHKYIKTLNKGTLKVIAVALEDDFYKWRDRTYDFSEFVHVYGEGKWSNPIGDAYGVTATPTYFILDANKNIIAKPDDFPALEEYYIANPIPTEISIEED
ncbi:MAG: TlpA family protein disulfide reductase [Oceanihabitans sp.]